jgi:NEDD8-activating enzyme E1
MKRCPGTKIDHYN